jgi:mevalonate kinase
LCPKLNSNDAFRRKVWDYTDFIEILNHGNPSGCDAATVINGGCIIFKKASPTNEVTLIDTNKLDCGFFVVNTNQPKNTKDLVAKVRQLKESDPLQFEEVIGLIGDTTQNIIETFQDEEFNRDALLDYVAMNQQYLQELGVSVPKIDEIVETTM